MISHAMVAFGAPVLGAAVVAVLGLITLRNEKRRKADQSGRSLLLKASHVTFDRDARRGPVKRTADGKVDYSDPNARDGGGQVTLRIFKCLKPVIAAVNGPALIHAEIAGLRAWDVLFRPIVLN